MAKPLVAIVGRPNVGKSMLFNKLTGHRTSIVEDTPGVTRDRIYGDCEWCGREFSIVDTGGIEPNTENDMLKFKSGIVLMAYKTKAKILPTYIAPREKWYHRQRIVIGEPYNVREELGKMPTLDQLAAASEAIRQKEFQLREYFEGLPVYKKLHKNDKVEEHSETEEEIKDEQCVQ